MNKPPENNLIIEIDNVARTDCDLEKRQQALIALLDDAGKAAFCYALASLMDAQMHLKKLKQQQNSQ